MRPTLLVRIGRYCSYCEYPIKHLPHAEHIIPKTRFREHRDRWENLIVSCSYCNGHKGDERPAPTDVERYLWPTRDNTARAFSYANVVPTIVDDLVDPVRAQAAMLRGLVDLGSASDERASERAQTYVCAQSWFARLAAALQPELLRQAIVEIAKERGFFSVWMEIFSTDTLMRRALIDAFAGTSPDCFDPLTTVPVPRPGGRL
jgi:hypothetical protein